MDRTSGTFISFSYWVFYLFSFQRGNSLKNYYSRNSILKIFNRIFKPFFCVLAVQTIIYLFLKPEFSFKGMILSGGIGPGAYYPWVYIQAWFFLPFIIKIIDKNSLTNSFIIFLSLCISLEIISSLLQVPEALYRLSFYRYIFVLYLACIVNKFNINKITPVISTLAIIGIIYSCIATYTNINFEPFFFFNDWRSQTWPTYFYTVFIFLLLGKLYILYPEHLITRMFINLGNYSYEIFLCQMFVFSFLTLNEFSFVNNIYLRNFLFITITTTLSIIPVILYKNRKNGFLNRRLKNMISKP